MTQLYYGSEERKLLPDGLKADAIIKYEGKCLGQDFNNPGLKKVQLRVVLQLNAKPEGGDRRYEKWLYFTPSLHEKAALRKFLKDWRGKDFTKDQLEGFKKNPFDISRLVNTCCSVRVIHETGEHGTKDQIAVRDQLDEPTFSVEWYADQREKWARDNREAEEYEAAKRKSKADVPRDEDDTTDYSAEPSFP